MKTAVSPEEREIIITDNTAERIVGKYDGTRFILRRDLKRLLLPPGVIVHPDLIILNPREAEAYMNFIKECAY